MTSHLQSWPAAAPAPAFRRILAASDLDLCGERAARRAARLPLAPGARVALVHVVPPWSAGPPAREREAARRALERAAAACRAEALAAGNDEPEVRAAVAEGWPSTEIVRAAWQERSELVVLGPPALRRDGSARAVVGRVMRRADLPLLVVRRDPIREYRRILCAVDRSVTAVETVALAARLAAGATRSITLFHACHVPFERWVGAAGAELEDAASAYLHALARELASEVEVSRIVVRRGDRGLETLRAAAEDRADVVVIGTHGRSGLARVLLGSTAEWLVANAPFDVAVSRPHRGTLERR